MNDLDPSQAASVEDIARYLRQLHVRADRPSYRALEGRTKHAKGMLPGTKIERVPLRRSTLSEVLNGQAFPRKAFLLTFVEACGIDLENDQRWGQAWDRLAENRDQAGGTAAAQARQQVGDLTKQLAEAERRAAEAERRAVGAQARVEADMIMAAQHAGTSVAPQDNRRLRLQPSSL